jgi:hypothetical protein
MGSKFGGLNAMPEKTSSQGKAEPGSKKSEKGKPGNIPQDAQNTVGKKLDMKDVGKKGQIKK